MGHTSVFSEGGCQGWSDYVIERRNQHKLDIIAAQPEEVESNADDAEMDRIIAEILRRRGTSIVPQQTFPVGSYVIIDRSDNSFIIGQKCKVVGLQYITGLMYCIVELETPIDKNTHLAVLFDNLLSTG